MAGSESTQSFAIGVVSMGQRAWVQSRLLPMGKKYSYVNWIKMLKPLELLSGNGSKSSWDGLNHVLPFLSCLSARVLLGSANCF